MTHRQSGAVRVRRGPPHLFNSRVQHVNLEPRHFLVVIGVARGLHWVHLHPPPRAVKKFFQA